MLLSLHESLRVPPAPPVIATQVMPLSSPATAAVPARGGTETVQSTIPVAVDATPAHADGWEDALVFIRRIKKNCLSNGYGK